jgi:phytoene dehydrogenase-like protein
MNSTLHYDVAIIGAGMSGLAAGIRLAHFGKRVCIFERHNAVGGLNSFYSIGGRKYDVGLHALTNYVAPGVKGTPLGKLLRQLRIDRDELQLSPQKRSRVAFGEHGETSLAFNNDPALLEAEIAKKFPGQIDGFKRLVAAIQAYDGFGLDAPVESAREVVRRFIDDPLLEAMLFCPVMYYGSAEERDMAFRDFVILFRSILLEGMARPADGVRRIIRVLLDKYREAGGERRMKCGVKKIIARDGRASALLLDDNTEVTATHVLSSIGSVETERLYREAPPDNGQVGRLSFVETIQVFDRPTADFGWGDDTIIFFSTSPDFRYERPVTQVDTRSGVICFPGNFDTPPGAALREGMLRCTCLADYDQWKSLPEETYRADKERWFREITSTITKILPRPRDEAQLGRASIATDMFTPLTIERFTGHLQGAVYGSPYKNRQGNTDLANLYLCGTDQGYLGIVGAMLSGISMANFHILQKS